MRQPRPRHRGPLRTPASPACRAAHGAAGLCPLPPGPAITKREETSFDLRHCLFSTKGEGEKRNPFSINTLQVHSSNQAEAAVKNSSASPGLVPRVRGALAAGGQAQGRHGGACGAEPGWAPGAPAWDGRTQGTRRTRGTSSAWGWTRCGAASLCGAWLDTRSPARGGAGCRGDPALSFGKQRPVPGWETWRCQPQRAAARPRSAVRSPGIRTLKHPEDPAAR